MADLVEQLVASLLAAADYDAWLAGLRDLTWLPELKGLHAKRLMNLCREAQTKVGGERSQSRLL